MRFQYHLDFVLFRLIIATVVLRGSYSCSCLFITNDREIAAGEELTFNYNFMAIGQERLHCSCGASNCSGFLGTTTTVNSTHASSRTGDDDAGTSGQSARAKRHDTAADGGNGHDSTKSSAAGSGGGLLNSRSTQHSELVLVREERHERVCYR